MEHEAQSVPGQLPQAAPSCCSIEHDERARARLLRAAADIFDRKGYAGASVREIVEQAGITKPVLYYHYGSKEGILLAILEEGARLMQAGLERAVDSPGTARQRLQRLFDEMFGLFHTNISAVRVAHAIFFGPREALPPFDFDKYDAPIRRAIKAIVEDGMSAGEIRRADAADVVMVIAGLIGLFTDLELTPNAPVLTLDDVHRLLDLMFDGLIPTRGKEN